jgi:drug/metabolite transporter (DMT)-like permease
MHTRLSPSTALLLTLPPLMWAGNAVVGRMVAELVPPMMLNLLRWALAALILLPLAAWVLKRESGLWTYWKRFAWLGLLSVGAYNALQYLALKTSSPINVTLVAARMPIWMLLIGRLFFHAPVSRRQLLGALLSISGVLLVLSRGHLETLLQVQLLPGDIYILVASICWAFYSWMLARPGDEPAAIRGDWAAFLMAQVIYGLAWSALFAAGEWAVVDRLGLATDRGPGLCGRRAGRAGLPRLGHRRATRRPHRRQLLRQPHATARGADVSRPAGRTAPALPRCRLCAHRLRHRGVISTALTPPR